MYDDSRTWEGGTPRRLAGEGPAAHELHVPLDFALLTADHQFHSNSDADFSVEAESRHFFNTDGATDSTVPMPFPPEQRKIGAMLSTAEGGPSVLLRVLQAYLVVIAALVSFALPGIFAGMIGMAVTNALLYVSGFILAVGFLCVTLVLGSTRAALRSGGALERLGVGEQFISVADARTLARKRVVILVVAGVNGVLLGIGLLAMGVLNTGPIIPPAGAIWQFRLFLVRISPFFFFHLPLIFCGWMSSMLTASCLCRDNVTEVIKQVRNADPAAKDGAAWQTTVEAPALALRGCMHDLCQGWSRGLIGLGTTFGFVSLWAFTLAMNSELCRASDVMLALPSGLPLGTFRIAFLVVAAFVALCTVPLALDLATISSRCDLLMDELNKAGIKHGVVHQPTIGWLEERLRKLASQFQRRVRPILAP